MNKDRVAYVEVRFSESDAAPGYRSDCDREGYFTADGFERKLHRTLKLGVSDMEVEVNSVTVLFLQDQVDEVRTTYDGR